MSDRGMMKWNAFNALISHGDNVKNMFEERKKIAKPILTEDRLEEINYKLELAVTDFLEIKIYYYQRGFIEEEIGKIKKVDIYTRLVHINNEKIKLDDIIQIDL